MKQQSSTTKPLDAAAHIWQLEAGPDLDGINAWLKQLARLWKNNKDMILLASGSNGKVHVGYFTYFGQNWT